ncbi:MAG: hypothetical protein LKF96_11405 [Treponema sp.]|jgi:hypothetical protein|nr:hypothetical protein [Treponema sp.]
MTPVAIYYFKHIGTSTRYLLESHAGKIIPEFPATWIRGPNKGRQYIVYRPTVTPQRAGHRYFSFTFSLSGNKTFTGVTPSEKYPSMLFGDDKNIGRNDAVLFLFTENGDCLNVYFFEGEADNALALWNKWTVGNLCMTVDAITATPEKVQGKKDPPIMKEPTGK